MNTLLTIFIAGLGILIGAIIINAIASAIGLSTWYTFINQIGDSGIKAISKQSPFSLIFLFIIYPLFLGAIAFYILKTLT